MPANPCRDRGSICPDRRGRNRTKGEVSRRSSSLAKSWRHVVHLSGLVQIDLWTNDPLTTSWVAAVLPFRPPPPLGNDSATVGSTSTSSLAFPVGFHARGGRRDRRWSARGKPADDGDGRRRWPTPRRKPAVFPAGAGGPTAWTAPSTAAQTSPSPRTTAHRPRVSHRAAERLPHGKEKEPCVLERLGRRGQLGRPTRVERDDAPPKWQAFIRVPTTRR